MGATKEYWECARERRQKLLREGSSNKAPPSHGTSPTNLRYSRAGVVLLLRGMSQRYATT